MDFKAKYIPLLCLLFLLCSYHYLWAQGDCQPQIYFGGESTMVTGQTKEITVKTNEIDINCNYMSVQFELSYDNSIVQYAGYTDNNTFFENKTIEVNHQPGKLTIGCVRADAMIGAGDIIKLQFKAIQVGESALTLRNVTLNDTEITDLVHGNIIVATPESAGSEIIEISAGNASGNVGEGISVPVRIDNINADDIVSVQFDCYYDYRKLQYISYNLGTSLFEPNNVQINPQTGLVKIGCISDAPLQSTGDIIVLNFKAIAPGTVLLKPTNAVCNDYPVTSVNEGTIELLPVVVPVCDFAVGSYDMYAMEGEVFEMYIYADGLTGECGDIHSMQFDLLYDNTIIEFKEIKDKTANSEAHVNSPGNLRFALIAEEKMTGTGIVATLLFEAVGNGVTFPEFSNFLFNDKEQTNITNPICYIIESKYMCTPVLSSPEMIVPENYTFDYPLRTGRLNAACRIISFQFTITYDQGVLTYNGYQPADMLSNCYIEVNADETGIHVGGYVDNDENVTITGIGDFMYLNFTTTTDQDYADFEVHDYYLNGELNENLAIQDIEVVPLEEACAPKMWVPYPKGIPNLDFFVDLHTNNIRRDCNNISYEFTASHNSPDLQFKGVEYEGTISTDAPADNYNDSDPLNIKVGYYSTAGDFLEGEGPLARLVYNTPFPGETDFSVFDFAINEYDIEFENPSKIQIAAKQIVWEQLTGLSVDNDQNLTKTAEKGWENAGAFSTNILPEGEDGFIAIHITKPDQHFAVGFSRFCSDGDIFEIEQAVEITSSLKANIYLDGTLFSFGPELKVGDLVVLAREGNYIKYYLNQTVFFEFSYFLGFKNDYFIDLAVYGEGCEIDNIYTNLKKPPVVINMKSVPPSYKYHISGAGLDGGIERTCGSELVFQPEYVGDNTSEQIDIEFIEKNGYNSPLNLRMQVDFFNRLSDVTVQFEENGSWYPFNNEYVACRNKHELFLDPFGFAKINNYRIEGLRNIIFDREYKSKVSFTDFEKMKCRKILTIRDTRGLQFKPEDENGDPILVWDGKYKGIPVNDGTYFYTLELIHGDGSSQALQGTIVVKN